MADKPEEIVDGLLAAPDATRKSETERAKYVMRKARDKAREAQLKSKKLKTSPSIEDMLADIVRVAEDEETNPFFEFRSMSRRRYELYGDYWIDWIEKEFGQFNHALEVCGLRDQPGERVKKAARAIASRNEHAARYIRRYVHPYVARQETELRQSYLLLSISDTHSTFLDPFVWHAFLSAVRDLKPDGVLFNGDTLEGSAISSHPQIPGWVIPLSMEFAFQREMARQVRCVHDGDLFVNAGNHGLDRWARYLTQTAPEIAEMPELRIDKLMGLDKHDVQLMQGGTIASPEGTEDDEPGFLMFGFYRPHHGTKLGRNPARSELETIGRSGQSGHVHRADIAFGCTERDKGLSWMCTPMGCTERAGQAYIKSPNKAWQKGFGVAWLFPNGQVRQYPVLTDGDVCFIEGFEYHREPDLPDPDPRTLWLPEMPLP